MTARSARISVNKLGEYMDATPSRRKAIIQAQHRPPGGGIVARYSDAYEVLKEYFADPSPTLLRDRAEELRKAGGGTEWAMQDRSLSADALTACANVMKLIDLDGVRVVTPFAPQASTSLVLAGVRISVRPDFLIVAQTDPTKVLGGMKLSFTKNYPLGLTGCEYVSTLLRMNLSTAYSSSVENKYCLSIAPPTKQVVSAPKAYKARMSAVEAACEEILIRWKSLDAAQVEL